MKLFQIFLPRNVCNLYLSIKWSKNDQYYYFFFFVTLTVKNEIKMHNFILNHHESMSDTLSRQIVRNVMCTPSFFKLPRIIQMNPISKYKMNCIKWTSKFSFFLTHLVRKITKRMHFFTLNHPEFKCDVLSRQIVWNVVTNFWKLPRISKCLRPENKLHHIKEWLRKI